MLKNRQQCKKIGNCVCVQGSGKLGNKGFAQQNTLKQKNTLLIGAKGMGVCVCVTLSLIYLRILVTNK